MVFGGTVSQMSPTFPGFEESVDAETSSVICNKVDESLGRQLNELIYHNILLAE